ncbi:MAG: PQQ-binding-like beta-propeller repeat protein, partial [Verrucomicrobiota bacterium]
MLLAVILLTTAHESLGQVGTKLWGFAPPGGVSTRIGSSPATDPDGTIYAGYTVDSGVVPSSPTGKLVALNPNGTVKWTFNSAGSPSSPTIGADGTIYFGTGQFLQNNLPASRFYAIGRDGAQKWRFETRTDFGSPAIAADGTIYAADRENLAALNSDGSVKWKYSLGGPTGFLYMAPSPAVGGDGTVYIDGIDARLLAIDPDGNKKWEFRAGLATDLSSPTIGADGTIYVGGAGGTNDGVFGGKLLALNPNGTLQWEFVTGGPIQASPIVGRDGTIY